MEHTKIPAGYRSLLGVYDTQKAIGLLHHLFEDSLSGALRLRRVSAPLFVSVSSGLNDDLNGVERPVSFEIRNVDQTAAVVHSLAKWKRLALHRYRFQPGEGLYTDMNAIRRDEDLDNLHSAYVDQWDWEKVITAGDRNLDTLKSTVSSIVHALASTQRVLKSTFPQLEVLPDIDQAVAFITSQELEDLFPDKTPKEREHLFVKDHPTTFLMGIGGKLRSGAPHDGRAPDYDDWDLNGDLLVWDSVGQRSFEVSSMGIRVDAAAMDRQLTAAGCDERRKLPFHQMLLNGELPQSIGGGIGMSRVCMLLLEACHIGEVQVSLWDKETLEGCEKAGITLL